MYNKNAAYDFEAFSERKNKTDNVVKLPGSKSRRKEKLKVRRIFLTSMFSFFIIGAIGVSAFVLGRVKLTELTEQACQASKTLQESQSLNTQLSVKLESAKSAAGKFGNEKNEINVEIIKVAKGDKAQIS